ncbi:ABC transporter permease [Acidovorax sp. Leaf76]|uniref:ABC transporter permease n=1 Tax=unclassified Acidovorax TaxID=2684926 RepID=UPI0007002390|nr:MULTISPECIES: ABC transporter permease [unclassified Acidovorax]KQO25963.1 ABC transporter permease [Acidovorax sp. Leaf76]KQO28847.1 ABC transporter permease [Acidovorax sp. Leaf84]KQS40745.1 ABC transporter permease [Acidovorax sp. Leaf191]
MQAMLALLRTFSWQDLRHHPWRSAAAVVAVMLGVALAFAVHVINASALDEFSQAVRAVNGQPDLELRAMQGSLPEALYGQLATHPQVARASPVLEVSAVARAAQQAPSAPSTSAPTASTPTPPTPTPPALRPSTSGTDTASAAAQAQAPTPIRLLGIDALLVPGMAPALMPRPWPGADRFALFAPATVFLNASALQALGLPATPRSAAEPAPQIFLQAGLQQLPVHVAGTVAAGGAPLAVMDIGAAQDLWGRVGQLSRIDIQLQPGTDRTAWEQSVRALPSWPGQLVFAQPGDAAQRISNLSRAYRVNLTVLALVALFTGAFLVFSVLALSVAQRAPQFALLAVLGATPRQRLVLVLTESALLGLVGSAAGVALGTALAATALQLLGGDLGGGYFSGVQPALQWGAPAALAYGTLGVLAALVGGWWPARAAQGLPPAQTLKGLGAASVQAGSGMVGVGLIAAGALLTRVPPVKGIPLAAYLAIALLLVGGISLLPWGMAWLLRHLQPLAARHALPLLALERARRMRGSAAIAVGGVVASLSLAVALTVMVSSFRGSVTQWLDAVLPSPLYVRSAVNAPGSDAALLPAGFAEAVAQLPDLERTQPLRASPVQLDATRPALMVISRPLGPDPARNLPLVGDALPVPAGRTAVYVSEAVVDLYGLRPGMEWPALSKAFSPLPLSGQAPPAIFFIAGVWRDYARQSGAVVMDRAVWLRLTGDARASDLALWPREGADLQALQQSIRGLAATMAGGAAGTDAGADRQSEASSSQSVSAPGSGTTALVEFVSSSTIRERSLRIFDRSFAVTYWLQAVAIGIGLFGVAASFSAQILARRKEFGLLAHLGLTRRQILAVVAGEGAAWTGVGAVAGVLLGLAVSVVLVHVVNPQSFHWTMDLEVPLWRLLGLSLAVVASGTFTAWAAGRAAAGSDAVMAVKEDW